MAYAMSMPRTPPNERLCYKSPKVVKKRVVNEKAKKTRVVWFVGQEPRL